MVISDDCVPEADPTGAALGDANNPDLDDPRVISQERQQVIQ